MQAISPASALSPLPLDGAAGGAVLLHAEFGMPVWTEPAKLSAAPARVAGRKTSRYEILSETARAMLARAHRRLAGAFRRSFVYPLTLIGRAPRAITFPPHDLRPARLEDADGFFRGRFRFAGATVQIRSGSIFDCVPPTSAFAEALHGFDWLRHVEAVDSEPARDFALKLVKHWMKRNARYRLPSWSPEIIAARLMNVFAHSDVFLRHAEPDWRRKFFRSLRDRTILLQRSLNEAPNGLPRLECAAALMLAGMCLKVRRQARLGWKSLRGEIARQILADGGHISRSPEALLDAFRVLSMLAQTMADAYGEAAPELKAALERMAGAVRFFRLGDGALASFNGGMEADAALIATLIDKRGAITPASAEMPSSGYRRIAAARTVLIADTGAPPPFAFSDKAHAGCLSFELSVGAQRLIVNCGAAPDMDAVWERSLRSTAAHSTLTLGNCWQSTLLEGRPEALLGERIVSRPSSVIATAGESAHGRFIEASHDAYVEPFGLLHRRRLTLSPRGLSLTGADRLEPVARGKRGQTPFAVRFHIHPDIRVSLAQDGRSVLLKFPNRDGWRFRWGGAELAIEESVYLGSRPMRRAEQLVLTGMAGPAPVECAWLFEQMDGA